MCGYFSWILNSQEPNRHFMFSLMFINRIVFGRCFYWHLNFLLICLCIPQLLHLYCTLIIGWIERRKCSWQTSVFIDYCYWTCIPRLCYGMQISFGWCSTFSTETKTENIKTNIFMAQWLSHSTFNYKADWMKGRTVPHFSH